MNLQHLKWTKNINPQGDEPWAYEQFGVDSLPKLAWRDGEANASKPQREDLVLLRQKGFVTHLVKVLDYKPERETGQGEFDIYRIVEVLWVIAWNNLPVSTKADEVFGYPEVLNYQGGNVMELENIIPKHWESKGGLEAFRNHVLSQLNLV